jgi:hypothetical protein
MSAAFVRWDTSSDNGWMFVIINECCLPNKKTAV